MKAHIFTQLTPSTRGLTRHQLSRLLSRNAKALLFTLDSRARADREASAECIDFVVRSASATSSASTSFKYIFEKGRNIRYKEKNPITAFLSVLSSEFAFTVAAAYNKEICENEKVSPRFYLPDANSRFTISVSS